MVFWLLLVLPFITEPWLSQFENQDKATATELLNQIDYFSYEQIYDDLKALHKKLIAILVDKEVVYSKTYVAKSGDLISYFYRTSNKIPCILFKNLSEPVEDKGNIVLV